MRTTVAVVALIVGLMAPRSASAWNGTGHETAALIAFDQLSPDAKKIIVDVLKEHPRRDQDLLKALKPNDDPDTVLFITAATWPDIVRSLTHPMHRTEDHPAWQLVDFPFDLDPANGPHGPQPDEQGDGGGTPKNLLQAMNKCMAEIADKNVSAAQHAIILCWVLHLTGDVHQPLHAASLFSADFPKGDRGGNMFIVRTNDNRTTPLHTLWDHLEGVSMTPGAIRKIAKRIEKEHPKSEFQQELTKMAVKDWAMESFELAKSNAYLDGKLQGTTEEEAQQDPTSVPLLPADYEADARDTADARIALAGYRLAALLEGIANKLGP